MRMHKCKKHGTVKAHGNGRNTRCSVCNNERMKHKHTVLKNRAIKYGGGMCRICGYNKCWDALEFHHVNQDEKDFYPLRGYKKSWSKLKAELDKCILVCANCHREIHSKRE